MSDRVRDNLSTLVVVLGLLVSWEVAAQSGLVSRLLFPAPSASVVTLWEMTASGELLGAMVETMWRLVRGGVVGIVAGTAVGLVLGISDRAHRIADPIVSALHPIPKLTVLPLALVVFGLGDGALIAVIALSTGFPMAINVTTGARAIDPLHAQVAVHYGLVGWDLVRKVVLPGSLPFVLAGLRLAVNAAFRVTLAVELIFAASGLGGLLWRSWERFRLTEFYATLVVIAILGLLMTSLVNRLGRAVGSDQGQMTRVGVG